jgi:23S rRNA pseudouridine955/2504/2580 synthase
MIQLTISDDAAEQRMDRFLSKWLPRANKGFLMKMLRKKRIKLDGHRAGPRDYLQKGQVLTFYFSKETYRQFRGEPAAPREPNLPDSLKALMQPPLYEDDHLIAVNKPVGLLTQPDHTGAPSLADLAGTLPHSGTFHPAPVNRLDRNTSGVVLIPKDYPTQKQIAAAIGAHHARKSYWAIVAGKITRGARLHSRLTKDAARNIVREETGGKREAWLRYRPLCSGDAASLIAIELGSGRSHQIRVQLAGIGHPIVGDPKYGSRSHNREWAALYGLHHQLLHARRYTIPELSIDVAAPPPERFCAVAERLGLTLPRI